MKERPILFSGPLVRAILAGTKTVTRRPIARPAWFPACGDAVFNRIQDGYEDGCPRHVFIVNDEPVGLVCPYGAPWDRLWCRETWAPSDQRHSHVPILYRADGDDQPCLDDRWRPSIHMPRWASRLTLDVVSVRAERLHDITEEDARAEGVDGHPDPYVDSFGLDTPYRASFAQAWERIYGTGAWTSSPWVWRVEFRRADGARRPAPSPVDGREGSK